MKMFNFSKKAVSIIALLLAILMMFSACGGDNTSSTESTESIEQTDQKNESVADATSENTDTATQSATQNTSKQNAVQQSSNVQTNSSKTTWDADYLKNIPADVKKKEIHVLMWRKYDAAEQKLVDEFQQKTGMKIRTTITTEQEYTTKLISLVSGGDSPDVVMISTSSFPGVVTKSCAPLDPKVYRLDDKIWYKEYMDCFQVNGKYFSVAVNKSPSCEDTNYVMYYLKSALKQCGVTTTPWQLYKQGKWNWAAQKDIIMKVSAKGYTGLSMLNVDTYMYSIGSSFVKYNGKQYSNSMDDPNILKAWKEFTEINGTTGVAGWDYKNIAAGKVGLFESISYQGLMASEVFRDANGKPTVQGGIENIECVPVPGPTQSSAYVPVRAKSWANAKGSKNPEGAAYFLRYFLDVNNTDYDSLFHNKQIREVYDTICDKKARKYVTYAEGVVSYTNSKQYTTIINALANSTPANIQSTLDKYKSVVNAPIKQANNALSRIK